MWRFWIDTGGTFTDCLARSPEGQEKRIKVLSNSALRGRVAKVLGPRSIRVDLPVTTGDGFFADYELAWHGQGGDPIRIRRWHGRESVAKLDGDLPTLAEGALCSLQSPEEAPVLAMRLLTGCRLSERLPNLRLRLATTRATNALLEGKGARIAFFVSKGFRDLIDIGDQRRPELFELGICKAKPLYQMVFEVDERLDAEGNELAPLDEEALEGLAGRCLEAGIDTVAIAFLHSYRDPSHERLAASILRRSGISRLSLSSELAPMIKLLPRAETAIVDAYLAPIMDAYLESVQASIQGAKVSIMTSAGGLVSRSRYRPKDSLLSGPAGGVVGASEVGMEAGQNRIIAFDMGGTSSDVSRYDGRFDYRFEQAIGDARVFAPALRIETVAAGGGSLCWFDGTALRVGPESAGAAPGPACYGAGGPLTLTDVNLLLGRLDPARFSIPVYPELAAERLTELVEDVKQATGESVDAEEALRGFLEIANERMAEAIRGISLREGYSPSEYALVAFGGAGGLHACAIANILGMDTIIFPSDAGLLSAFGLRQAKMEEFAEKQILASLAECEDRIEEWIRELELKAGEALRNEGIAKIGLRMQSAKIELRFRGQEATLFVDWQPSLAIGRAFRQAFDEQYGFVPDQEIEVVSLKVAVATQSRRRTSEPFPQSPEEASVTGERGSREALIGKRAPGPLVIQDAYSTIFVESGWLAVGGARGTIRLTRLPGGSKTERIDLEAAQLELFTNRFLSLVEEMGSLLQRSAFSTNVKERQDFSCALLDGDGGLIANAPHIPVHLGALGVCVREMRQSMEFEPGDVVVTNHPGFGGSHLPDVTLVSAVFSPNGERIGYVANRAHHAELGGIAPGSMPPSAASLQEEGVVIEPLYLARGGQVDWDAVERVLTESPYPTRALRENLSDLAAQLASIRFGARELESLAREAGVSAVRGYMAGLKRRASVALRAALQSLPEKLRTITERLDNGAPITVGIRKVDRRWRFDFEGSAPIQNSNYNATPAIVTSAVIYVLRLLAGSSLPLNEGLLADIDLIIPEGMLNPGFQADPSKCPPVVAGNVEISQRIVDTLLKALGMAACSQGTMNNLIFGNANASYYETIGGGEGATRERCGASGVHTHMTNTSITDPEILEWRYPARVECFAYRKGSGGRGARNGGDGLLRRIRFTESVEVSLISQHREVPPFGLEGGGSGATGRQWKIGRDGKRRPISGNQTQWFQAGEAIEIRTPGGGAFAKKPSGDSHSPV